jgi:hypothetical protein
MYIVTLSAAAATPVSGYDISASSALCPLKNAEWQYDYVV